MSPPKRLFIYQVTGSHSLEVKQLGLEAGCLPTSNDKVKNVWIYTSTPPYVHDMHRDNFTIISLQLYMCTLEENNKLKTEMY